LNALWPNTQNPSTRKPCKHQTLFRTDLAPKSQITQILDPRFRSLAPGSRCQPLPPQVPQQVGHLNGGDGGLPALVAHLAAGAVERLSGVVCGVLGLGGGGMGVGCGRVGAWGWRGERVGGESGAAAPLLWCKPCCSALAVVHTPNCHKTSPNQSFANPKPPSHPCTPIHPSTRPAHLLHGVARQHPKHGRHARVDARVQHAAGRRAAHGVVVRGRAAHDDADADHGVELAALGHGLGHHGQLEAAGHPAHLDVCHRRAVALERPQRPLEQQLGDEVVEAPDHDGEALVGLGDDGAVADVGAAAVGGPDAHRSAAAVLLLLHCRGCCGRPLPRHGAVSAAHHRSCIGIRAAQQKFEHPGARREPPRPHPSQSPKLTEASAAAGLNHDTGPHIGICCCATGQPATSLRDLLLHCR